MLGNKNANSQVLVDMAASLLVAVGAFIFSGKQNVAYAAGEHALAHVYHEINSLQKTQAISLETVNEKFAVLGGHLDELPGKVTYLMFCDFKGHINRGPDADTILVASLGTPLENYNDRINHAIRWLH